MGPWSLRDEGCNAPPVLPHGGLAAGARRAPDFSKCQMFQICEQARASSSLVPLRTWIGDATQRAEGLKRD
eukprot:4634786-Pyramimonas_sp.AAC.1